MCTLFTKLVTAGGERNIKYPVDKRYLNGDKGYVLWLYLDFTLFID